MIRQRPSRLCHTRMSFSAKVRAPRSPPPCPWRPPENQDRDPARCVVPVRHLSRSRRGGPAGKTL